jgi:hypothetical protein
VNTFLLCSGVHGQARGLDWLRRVVETRRPDGILFAGGVLPLERCYKPKVTLWGMTRADAEFVERFFRTLGDLGVFSAVIPGAGDTPLEEFLRLGMHAEVEFPAVHLAHATLAVRDGLAVTGLGGWVSEGSACELDCCPRTLALYHLRALLGANQPHRVLLLARPPAGPLGGLDGSRLSAELIDSLHPSLCVVGGGSEGAAVCQVAHTLVVNPGFLADGRAAWLDWRRGAEQRVELLDDKASHVVAATPPSVG